jgi:UDP-2,3-diacylglucosamine pyrophosphatase LpxH
MPRTIIVSDLHVDTWDDQPYGQGDRRKPKLQHWFDFLDFCEQKAVAELVINGDLMDAPPYQGNVSFTSPIARQAVERLLAYAGTHNVTYVYGNHDIGISGLRCTRDASLAGLKNVNLIYPDYTLDTGTSAVLIQHGHLYDPFLLAYVRDLDVRTYLLSGGQDFQWVQQRRNPATGAQIKPPGVASPAAINLPAQPESNIFRAIGAAEQAAPTTKQEMDKAGNWLQRLKDGAFRKVTGEVKNAIWREAAKDICEDFLGRRNPPLVYCTMGHTHVPDTYQFDVSGKPCIYFNSGTWTGAGDAEEDRAHATYLDLREDGKLWIQDWIRDPYLGP